MPIALDAAHQRLCDAAIWLCLRVAVAVDDHRRWTTRVLRRLRGSLDWLLARWRPARSPCRRRSVRTPWNRTPPDVETAVVRLHVEHPELGCGQLGALARRTLGFRSTRETIRRILLRRGDLVEDARDQRKRRRRSIDVDQPNRLWGTDLTLVWLLGFWPVWLMAIVDYHGSRLIALERVRWPTSGEVLRVMDAAVMRHGAPERVLTDRGACFTSWATATWLDEHGIQHTTTRPAHPWTNGRIERLFGTFKRTVFAHTWLFASTAQIDRWCRDFVQLYNRDRPHSRFDGRTPDEVQKGSPEAPALERITYFDGRLRWYRFG